MTNTHPTNHVHEKGEIWIGNYQGPGCPACYMTEQEIGA